MLVSTGIVSLAEMGDKTEIATVMQAAKCNLYWVVAGTTLGIVLADVPGAFALWPQF